MENSVWKGILGWFLQEWKEFYKDEDECRQDIDFVVIVIRYNIKTFNICVDGENSTDFCVHVYQFHVEIVMYMLESYMLKTYSMLKFPNDFLYFIPKN